MKLNKFLVVAVAATVLPLSVAHAEGPAVHDVPEFKGGVNPADAPVLEPAPAPKAIVNDKGDLLGTTDTLLAPTVEKPEFKGGVNGPGLVNEKPDYGEKLVAPEALNKDRVYLGEDGKLHAYEGVNGPGAVHGVKPYGTSLVAPEVHTKPEFKLPTQGSNDTFGPRKGQAPAKAQNGQKVLPKTSAVK